MISREPASGFVAALMMLLVAIGMILQDQEKSCFYQLLLLAFIKTA